MLLNEPSTHSLALSSQDSYILAFAIKKADTEPKTSQTSKDFFLQLRQQGQKVPDVLTTSLSSRITDLKESLKNVNEYSSPASKGRHLCFYGSIAATEIACFTGHPILGGIVCITGAASTITSTSCIEKICPSNRANLKTIFLESQEKIKTVVLEALDFSADPENALQKFLEKKIDNLNNALARPSTASEHLDLQRKKDLHTLALNDLLAVMNHYKLEGFTLQASETEQAEEETSIDSEDAATSLLGARSSVQPMMIDRV